ncbi:MAG: peptide-methionine (S)-S-oxide reductase MsrA [Chitinophagales bacterium]
MKKPISHILVICSLLVSLTSCGQKNSTTKKEGAKQLTMSDATKLDTITLGGGCFWCTEAIYQRLNGVVSVTSGYSGGKIANPTYREVCSGLTGHAEVVQIVFDTTKVSLAEVLQVFFKTHDPTTLNRQGNDEGTQYRSSIFYRNEEQRKVAEDIKSGLDKSGAFNDPIVTEIVPFTAFYKAEDYHQDYYNQNKNSNPYCTYVIVPKVEKFEHYFKDKLKK